MLSQCQFLSTFSVLNRLAGKKQDKQHDTLQERDSSVSRNRHAVSLIPRMSMRGEAKCTGLRDLICLEGWTCISNAGFSRGDISHNLKNN